MQKPIDVFFFSISIRFIDKDKCDLYLQMYKSKIRMSEEKRKKLRAENRRGQINNGRYQSLPCDVLNLTSFLLCEIINNLPVL
jgi:hypothetical protein